MSGKVAVPVEMLKAVKAERLRLGRGLVVQLTDEQILEIALGWMLSTGAQA